MTEKDGLSEEQMKMIDALYASPSDRATAVFNLLLDQLVDEPDATELGLAFWDVFCFSIEFLNMAAQGFGGAGLVRVAKAANYWLYTTHYNDLTDFLPAPDRLTWRAKYGVQSEQESNKEDGTIPKGDDGTQDDDVLPFRKPDETSPPD